MRRQEERWRQRRGQRQQKHTPLEQPVVAGATASDLGPRDGVGGEAESGRESPSVGIRPPPPCLLFVLPWSGLCWLLPCTHTYPTSPATCPPTPASVPLWGGPCLPHTVLISCLSHLYPPHDPQPLFSLASALNPQTHFSLPHLSPGSESSCHPCQ